jgi:hypothetical protein
LKIKEIAMPNIDRQEVLEVLRDPYFDHHVAMHLSRQRVDVYDPEGKPPGKTKVPPLLDPSHKCDDCKDMIVAGDSGSGRELLVMHHDMIRVFRYLLHQKGIRFGAEWEQRHEEGELSRSQWVRHGGGQNYYTPAELWNLDNPRDLPLEIRSLFSYADPDYLRDVFAGVKKRVEVHAAGGSGGDANRNDGPVDKLGRFIERGVDKGSPHGEGFHNTIHEYLGAREGKSATGAEMNKLRNSLFNDHFWSLHLWIDAQYGRLLENLGEQFETSAQPPGDPMAVMAMGSSMGSMPTTASMQKAMHRRMR